MVVLRANDQGVADTSVGSSQQVVASSSCHVGLPHEVAPNVCQVPEAPSSCRAQMGSQQSLPPPPQQRVGQIGVSPHIANSAVSGGSPCNPDSFLDFTCSAVPSQGGAVEICPSEPLEYHNPSPSPSPVQELNPEDFAQHLLAQRDFSAVSALRLVDLLPRDSGLRRVQGHAPRAWCLLGYRTFQRHVYVSAVL